MESVLTSAVQKLGNLLLEEAIFLHGVKDQVKSVEVDLKDMQSFLKDANDMQRKGDERVKNWVRKVTDVSFDAEDAIDSYMIQVEHRRQQQGLFGCIKRYASIPSLLKARHKLGNDIEDIKLKIDQISKSTITYKTGNLGETSGEEDRRIDELREARNSSRLPEVNEYTNAVIGFDVHCKRLVDQLLDCHIKRRYVVSIVGMGGLGKTTLAKMVYNDSEISNRFPIRIWVTASEDFQWRPFLVDMAVKAMGGTEAEFKEVSDERLMERVCDFLKSKVYFIVIDDVWEGVWQKIEKVVPDVGNGSRVLLTTRSESVAKSAEPIIPFFSLPLLGDEESWALFIRKAFPTEEGVDSVCPKELVALGRRMVNRCGRLPLALLVLGGLLSSQETTHLSWLHVEETMDWESTEDEMQCLNVLALSYRNLPDHNRRSCFLYIALFPEDSEISASELTRLWIAEDFIPQGQRETLEDTARRYLDNFSQRSMIQVLRRKADGSVLKFKIHDLLREMCLRESKEDKFFNIMPSSSGPTDYNSISWSRRLDLSNLKDEIRGPLPSNLRSLFIRSRALRITSTWKMLHSLKFLRVLYLKKTGNEIEYFPFPKPINSMAHLRYLKLFNIDEQPASIGNFRSLQTLDLRECLGIAGRLPKELGELPNLRHVLLHGSYFPAISTSTNLQTLKKIMCDQPWAQESLPRLQNLRRLGISEYKGNVEVLCDSISKLNHLSSLSVYCRFDNPVPHSIITSLTDNPHLVKLSIRGPLGPQPWLPESNNFPRNLTKLLLFRSKLEKDPMPVLEKLPNLMFLTLLGDAYVGNEMVFTTDGFPRLQSLELVEFPNLQDLIVQAGAFPKLARLRIQHCYRLKMLPQGLQHVTSLMELKVSFQSPEFRERLRKDVGADWYKIKHVPNITL